MKKSLVAEGLGTLLLVAVVVGSGIIAENLSPGTMQSPYSGILWLPVQSWWY